MLLPKQIRRLESKSIPEVPSPLYHNGLVYFVKNGGVLTCLELKTGKSIYRMRTSGSGTHYSSPIIADGKLFTISGAGRITVLSLGPAAKILATNEMGEPTYATPAVVDGTIYVRTHTRLFAFANQK
jgi:outer membrane protein assembly factor BamB